MKHCLVFLALAIFVAHTAAANDAIFYNSGQPIPRFVSLKSDTSNVRVGPGTRYPIRWVYEKAGLPVEVVEEFSHWRKIRDHEGEAGWVHKALLSGRRTAQILHETQNLLAKPEDNAPALIRAEKGVLVELRQCTKQGWCKVLINERNAWIRKAQLWGVYADEVFEK